MNGFQSGWRGISSHDRARTIGKKIANWTVGKSMSSARARLRRRVRRRTGYLLLLVLALIAAVPSTASAGCGGVQYKPAAKRPKRGRPPLAIGDSTMLLAMQNLSRA